MPFLYFVHVVFALERSYMNILASLVQLTRICYLEAHLCRAILITPFHFPRQCKLFARRFIEDSRLTNFLKYIWLFDSRNYSIETFIHFFRNKNNLQFFFCTSCYRILHRRVLKSREVLVTLGRHMFHIFLSTTQLLSCWCYSQVLFRSLYESNTCSLYNLEYSSHACQMLTVVTRVSKCTQVPSAPRIDQRA